MSQSLTNVLIVQSDSRETELVLELISDVGRVQVDTTNSCERALELANRTNYQLVIADASVGDMNAVSIIEGVKRVSPATSVIITSKFATIEEAVKVVRLGAEEYFKKPYNPEQFKLAVRRCLDRRELYTEDQGVSGLMLLLNSCQLVSGFLDEDKIHDTVVNYLKRATLCKGLALFRFVDGVPTHVPCRSEVDPDVVEVLVNAQNSVQACRDEKALMKIVPRTSTTPEIAVFQFKCAGDVDYYVVCISPDWKTPAEEISSRFHVLRAQTQMTGRNITNYRGVRHLLYLDEPTGLYNTRYLHLCLDQVFERRSKNGGEGVFSVLFVDVDKFKGINDSHGHLVGTKLLFEMGQILKRHLRKSDFAFRYGGDEFVALVDGATSAEACEIAESIRTDVEANNFLAKEGLNIKLTISVGVASCPEHALSKRDIIHAADGAMYAVKRSSRNSVYIAEKKAA